MANDRYLRVQQVRTTNAYSEARLLFDEKREVFLRLSEINRRLRDLQEHDPDAVVTARSDVPFRNPPGRQKSENGS